MRNDPLLPFSRGLADLPLLGSGATRSVSAENPDGAKGGGARAEPAEDSPARALGRGLKARPCLTNIESGATVTLADITGPGVIQHLWMTLDASYYREAILRIYWDEETAASVEVPIGDFFANGHGLRYSVNSQVVCVLARGGFNAYWPMPFAKRARFTLENRARTVLPAFFYQITYEERDVPETAARFHAQFRRSRTRRELPVHTIVDGLRGQGHYVGTHLAWTQLTDGWWGEGEVQFYLDGDEDYPTICGTGTEDYFGGAWGFGETYCAPYLGYPLHQKNEGSVPKHGLYRWHVLDPVRFQNDLRVTVQALGWWPDGRFQPLERRHRIDRLLVPNGTSCCLPCLSPARRTLAADELSRLRGSPWGCRGQWGTDQAPLSTGRYSDRQLPEREKNHVPQSPPGPCRSRPPASLPASRTSRFT